MMTEDPIVADVRAVRAAHAQKFNNDLLAIYRDLKVQERMSKRKFTSDAARRVVPANESMDNIARDA